MNNHSWPPQFADHALAVLVSGGLDSAVMLAEATRHYPAVHPLYVRTGSAWDEIELGHLQRFLKAIACDVLKPLHTFRFPVEDIYGQHWSITGKDVPDENSPDEAVFLPGRNLILLSKALIWCHLRDIPAVAMAPLEANPFPDATPEFYAEMSGVVNRAVGGNVSVITPYRVISKVEVIRRGAGLPLGFTFSCIRPVNGAHCGHCNKCAERQHAFAEAGVNDPTEYASK
ncbi:7-cyano-7-deazaguanine synthase [Zavarzinella formosa]|uniref:7-cyano-7-deazaguanine synthase n=1 Tax=Zavarzinella formosa TaxID=360055 RepID=UPI0003004470|nr:7-cyano-7-deazaguanine synthase [Zavarzinella formosa]